LTTLVFKSIIAITFKYPVLSGPRPKDLERQRTLGPLGYTDLIGNQQFKNNVYIAIKFLLRTSKWFIDADHNLTF